MVLPKISIEETPNPETLRFSTGCKILVGEAIELHAPPMMQPHFFSHTPPNSSVHLSMQEATQINFSPETPSSPLGNHVLSVQGIKSIFIASDFFAITKSPLYSWDHVLPKLMPILEKYFASNPSPEHNYTVASPGPEGDMCERIEEILETFVRPHVSADGGDVTLHAFDKGIVFLKLKGACSGCPSSQATLKTGIQRVLVMMIPEIIGVEAVDEITTHDMTEKPISKQEN